MKLPSGDNLCDDHCWAGAGECPHCEEAWGKFDQPNGGTMTDWEKGTKQAHRANEAIEQRAAVKAALAADRDALRDGFATAALAAIIAERSNYPQPNMQLMQAERAYEYADAMLKARKQ